MKESVAQNTLAKNAENMLTECQMNCRKPAENEFVNSERCDMTWIQNLMLIREYFVRYKGKSGMNNNRECVDGVSISITVVCAGSAKFSDAWLHFGFKF